MAVGARMIGRRLGLFGAMMCLTFSGTTGIVAAAPPNGIEILSPQEDQTVSSVPIPVRVNFNTAIQPGSFEANLNGLDVTARFTVSADTATASLVEADGIRISTDKTRHSNVLQVWMTGADDPSHRYHDRRAFVAKVSELPRPVSGVISPEGGTLVSPGIGQVTFPAGAFLADTAVELSVSRDPWVQQLFDDTAIPMFDATNRLGYELRITTGTVQPLKDPQVTFALPDSFRFDVTPGSEVRILAENFWDGPDATLDTLEVLPDRFPASNLQITATMPLYFFTDGLRADGVFELVTLTATMPTASATTVSSTDTEARSTAVTSAGEDVQPAADTASSSIQTGTCQGGLLTPPLNGPLNVKSSFGGRQHPILHTFIGHFGTDLEAGPGTLVKAMADGVVETVGYDVRFKNGKTIGWGRYVVLRHVDGSRTLYAHLQDDSPVAQGTVVHAGDRIADSDTTGGATGPHLHIEYAVNATMRDNGSKVDPMPCIAPGCTANLSGGTHNCGGVPGISVSSLSDGRLLLKLTFTPGQTAKFLVTYNTAPSQFSVNIGDSATNDGGGGDSSTQSNDAEAMIFDQQLSVFGRDGTPTQPLANLSNAGIGAGSVVSFEVVNNKFCWNIRTYTCVNNSWLYALDGQPDTEGPVNYDIYAAFNRVVSGRTDRLGTGVASVSVFLN